MISLVYQWSLRISISRQGGIISVVYGPAEFVVQTCREVCSNIAVRLQMSSVFPNRSIAYEMKIPDEQSCQPRGLQTGRMI